MKQSILKLKLELKALARDIKSKKKSRKEYSNGYVPGLSDARWEYRHKHVAYCLARGRTLEQIEPNNRIGTPPLDMNFINWILSSMKEDSNEKLYVVVDRGLSNAQKAVQSSHAVAQFLIEHPNTQWKNGTLVLMEYQHQKDGRDEVPLVMQYIWAPKYKKSVFKEPDLNNKVTAGAFFGPPLENLWIKDWLKLMK